MSWLVSMENKYIWEYDPWCIVVWYCLLRPQFKCPNVQGLIKSFYSLSHKTGVWVSNIKQPHIFLWYYSRCFDNKSCLPRHCDGGWSLVTWGWHCHQTRGSCHLVMRLLWLGYMTQSHHIALTHDTSISCHTDQSHTSLYVSISALTSRHHLFSEPHPLW